jgi:hypothetical protein
MQVIEACNRPIGHQRLISNVKGTGSGQSLVIPTFRVIDSAGWYKLGRQAVLSFALTSARRPG